MGEREVDTAPERLPFAFEPVSFAAVRGADFLGLFSAPGGRGRRVGDPRTVAVDPDTGDRTVGARAGLGNGRRQEGWGDGACRERARGRARTVVDLEGRRHGRHGRGWHAGSDTSRSPQRRWDRTVGRGVVDGRGG